MQFCQQTDESTDDDLCVTVDAPDIDTTFTVTNLTDNKESKLTLDSSLYTDDGNSSYTFQTAAIYDINDEYEICVENLPGWTEVAVKTGNVDVDGSCATLTLDPGENHLEFNNYENPNEPEPTATDVVVPTEPTADDPTETLATEPSETEIPVPTEVVEEPTQTSEPTMMVEEPTQTPEPNAIPGYPATFPGVNFSHYSCVDGEAKGRVSLGYTDSIRYVSIVFGDTTIVNPSGNSNWVVTEGDAVTILVEVRQGYRFPDPVTGPWPSSWHNPETDRNYEWTLVPGTTDRAQIVVPVVSTGKDCPPVPTIPPVTETPTPDSTETPQVTETPEVTETPNATEPPEVTETPDIEDLETPSPEIPGTPDISTPSPEATETPASTETPEVIETPTMLPTWSLSDSVCVDDKPVHIYTITPGVGFEDTKVEIGFNSNVFNHITWIEGDDGTVESGTFEVPNATYFTLWTTLRDGFEIPENLTGWTPVGSQFKSTTGTSPNDACTSFPIFSASEVCNGSVGELRLEPYAPQGGGITFTAIQIDEQIVQWPGTTYIPGGSTVRVTYTHLGGNWIWPELPATLPGTDILGSWIVTQGDTRVFEFVVALELECGTITPEVTETPLPEIPGTPDVEIESTETPQVPSPDTTEIATPDATAESTPDSMATPGMATPGISGTPEVATPDVGGMYPTSILTPAPTNDPEMTKTPPGIPSDDHTATVSPTDIGKATPIGEFPGTGAGTSGPGTGEISILILTFVALAFIALGVRSNGNNQRLKD